ncbi:MAG: UMP kinase [Candidatus Geothermarchaeales archaeon]
MRAVIKLTGQLFNLGDPPTLKELVAVSSLLGRCHREKKFQLYVVTGGGETARKYIELARKQGVKETQLDIMGITASRLNAQLLISLIGEAAFPNPLTSLEELGPLVSGGKILVFGGILPGVSTNTVSALVAEMTGADLLITLSRSGCLYDKDPDTHEDAAPLEEATPEEVRRILSPIWEKAGLYPLFDRTALNVISRSKIPTIITAPKASELEKALKGEKTGTRIVFK